jgi:hypothetical protein
MTPVTGQLAGSLGRKYFSMVENRVMRNKTISDWRNCPFCPSGTNGTNGTKDKKDKSGDKRDKIGDILAISGDLAISLTFFGDNDRPQESKSTLEGLSAG